MNNLQQTLPLPPLPLVRLDSARDATRLSRFLRLLLTAVAVPIGIAVATPLVGVLFFLAVVLSPLLLVFALVRGRRQAETEHLRLDPGGSSTVAAGADFTRVGVRLAPSRQV